MALIECPECGRKISNKADECPVCGCPSAQWEKERECKSELRCLYCASEQIGKDGYCDACGMRIFENKKQNFHHKTINNAKPVEKKGLTKKKIYKAIKILLTIYIIFIVISVFQKMEERSRINSNRIEETEEINQEKKEEGSLSSKDYKEQCEELNYKEVLRRPDDYIGKKFKVTVRIFDISNGSLFKEPYLKTFTDDGSGLYFNNLIWIFDKRNKDSYDYVKLLKDDIVTFYGEFNGIKTTKNSITKETGDALALYIYYAELISEQ